MTRAFWQADPALHLVSVQRQFVHDGLCVLAACLLPHELGRKWQARQITASSTPGRQRPPMCGLTAERLGSCLKGQFNIALLARACSEKSA